MFDSKISLQEEGSWVQIPVGEGFSLIEKNNFWVGNVAWTCQQQKIVKSAGNIPF